MKVPVFTMAEFSRINRFPELKARIAHKRRRAECSGHPVSQPRRIPITAFNTPAWPVQPRCQGKTAL